MKMPTSFLITSKMFELGSCASQDSDTLLVLCVIAEVSCPMPSGNSDTLQVMPRSSRSNLNISNSLTFILHSRDTADRKKRKTTSIKESQQVSTWTQTQESKCPQQRGNFLSEKMQNAESKWQERQMLKANINGCLKKRNADGWVDRC